ncbi:ribonucleoside-diphosphate reductase subunit alpha [Microaceticoccus formicicus]|uniref:ribonucleoside-diphosphate reductase subunit alpha n=1 Tax=Microaceticoccus formicicus TaxID=3118105 RepID=UPI003CD01D05|nr:ribonucleoside-diphosphate reductase subunit alpha [Peptoniphilaceae bacterium AMB_02]
MNIIKRNGSIVEFDRKKIELAIQKAFNSVCQPVTQEILEKMSGEIVSKIESNFPKSHMITVEEVQDLVEITLIENSYYAVVKSYILYRASHHTMRKTIEDFSKYFTDEEIIEELKSVQREFTEDMYNLSFLRTKFSSFVTENMNEDQLLELLTRSASELTSKEAPNWEFIAARFLSLNITRLIRNEIVKYDISDFYSKIVFLTDNSLYGKYILDNYSREDIDELEAYIDNSRDHLFNFSGLDLVYKRYLIKDPNGRILESPQEMFMGISMHLAIPEADKKVEWAKKIYDILSTLKVTMATPTMSNARKPFHQLSSCFIDTVPDSLDGIYRSIDNFAQVSKHGGGMGLYFGKVRAMGSDIRGFKGVAGGVNRWIKLANDTAVAVDQLGVRQGAVAVYLDAWHKDLPEFLQLKTNSGDDRMKAHDVFPGICFPNYFWELAKESLDNNWYLMCPHEIKTTMGYSLEDYYGDEWKKRYEECVNNPKLDKRAMSIKDIVRLFLKSAVETGTPFVFNRDIVNKYNPNNHKGMIYSSNLCTEIAQNMSGIESVSIDVESNDDGDIVTTKTKAGDFVVCNLASLVLGNIEVNDSEELKRVVTTVVRALDNVIELNYYPIPYAKITNKKYRSIGLGTSGYHHVLVKNDLNFQSDEHLDFADKLYEDINYYAIKASMEIAKEKGSYHFFEGSDWQNGDYFEKRAYNSSRWIDLKNEVQNNGIRNGYLMAVAPTGSTSIIAGTTAAIDPVMKRYYLEEKKGSIVPRVAPSLTPRTFWLYENAHEIDQNWVIKAAGIRQRHIDQGQSLNLYVTTDYTMSRILGLYIKAWEEEVKTIYYVRSQALEIEECDSCSA